MPYGSPALLAALCKSAQQETWWDRVNTEHPLLSSLAYINPLTAAPTSVMSAYNNFSRGKYGRGALDLVWTLGSLVPGGFALRGLSGLGRIGRAMAGRGPAFVRMNPTATGLGSSFVNTWRRAVNPVKGLGNSFMEGVSESAPGLAGFGNALDRGTKSVVGGLSRLQGGTGSLYSKTMSGAMLPAIGLSLIPEKPEPPRGGYFNPQNWARSAPMFSGWNSAYNGGSYSKRAAFSKSAQSVTVGDLMDAVSADTGLGFQDRSSILETLREAFPNRTATVSPMTGGAVGALIAWLISKYFGAGFGGSALMALGGFGLGHALQNSLNNPHPGFRPI